MVIFGKKERREREKIKLKTSKEEGKTAGLPTTTAAI